MKRFIVGFIPLSFMVGLPTIAGRMACVLTAALLLCASSAHGQVIEEGGFPVKGGGVSGEPFSLSCPPRLYVAAGESVLFSCSATAVPEEGVRYEWESLSGDGLHLLSASDELSPLFTAPLSGESVEYVYRLAAMSVGVYETATVTVSVEVVSGETVSAPVVQEECDSFGGFGRDREGCHPWEKAPWPDSFGGLPEDEGIVPWPSFPESPAAEEKEFAGSSGAGPFPQTPPYLDCPVAVFLEELETGAIECHVSDASGEEFLEYSWEPVGSTTRDYMDNPRLIPEDAPNPSVVAPEAPVYETLESFHSGETTFRYRYRLTVTSRATGLSSSSEVEVFVSSSRPSVYCPLEVVVEEGSTAQLDCEGVDPLSSRMDYDEDGASIAWEWEGLWGTSTAHLDATDMSSPLFMAPVGSAGEEYHYIASMTSSASGMPRTARRRVTVTVTGGEEGTQAAADDSALMFKGSAPVITCNNAEVYEDTADFTLDCSVTDEPTGATYAWTARGSTSDTDDLSSTTVLTPTFDVPDEVGGADKTYRYTVTMSAADIDDQAKNVTVIVLEKPNIGCTLLNPDVNVLDRAMEPGEQWTFDPCLGSFVGAPSGSEYKFTWIGVWTACCTPEIALAHLDRTDVEETVFTAPTASPNTNSYIFFTYELIVSAKNADPYTISPIGVTVQTPQKPQLSITCSETLYEVETGDPDFDLDCEAAGAWSSGFEYEWQWSPTDNLTGHDTGTPTFDVPGSVESDTTWTYTVSVSTRDHLPADETVEVTVREPKPSIVCSDAEVYEATADFTLDCSVTNEPTGSSYSWTARGSTSDTDDLSSTTILAPTFSVPDSVNADTDYNYTVTLSASGVDDVTEDVTVTVKKLTCLRYGQVHDGYFYGINEGDMRGVVLDVCHEITGPGPFSYSWSNRLSILGGLDRLSNTNERSPTFTPPNDVETLISYGYSLEISSPNAKSLKVYAGIWIYDTNLTCQDSVVYEGSANFDLDCSIVVGLGAPYPPPRYGYTWVARDDTPNTDLLIAGRGSLAPTFAVPDNVDADTDYKYRLTVIGNGGTLHEGDVTVTVKNTPSLTLICTPPTPVYEGSADFDLDCSASGTPEGSEYDYVWTVRGATPNTDKLSSTTIEKPTFDVPEEVAEDETYRYTLTASAENAEDVSANVTVRVLNKEPLALVCTPPTPVYEGSTDFALDCSASGAPSGSTYDYVWTARGATPNTDKLSSTTIEKPTFDVPEEVAEDETYRYTLTASAENAENGVANVTVRVLNKEPLALICTPPTPVYEGSTDFALDCSASGAPSGSTYDYVWTARGATPNTDKLSSTTVAKPTFDVPEEVDRNETYRYTLTASAENAEDASANVTVRVLNKEPLALICTPPTPVYEGSTDFALDCSASGAPSGSTYDYVWTARGATPNTDKLSSTTVAKPTFDVPEEVDRNETYRYTLTASAENAEDASANVTVRVLNKEPLALICTPPTPVYEGAADFDLDCVASGAPQGSTYDYVWTARGATPNTDKLSSTTVAKPTFDVPEEVAEDETYRYTLTASAENAEDASANVTVQVLNKEPLALVCTPVAPVYEGSEDFALDCSASGAPSGSTYDYVWTARGATPNTGKLSSTTIAKPTFDVPEEVDRDETYRYTLTASAENAEDVSANVTVRVLNKEPLALICTPPTPVYEGSADFALDCSASGAPSGSTYDYVWTARGATPNTDKLSSTTIAKPTFDVPEEVDRDETYRYTLTASAENAEDVSANVTVRVLNKEPLALICTPPTPVYEGSEDFALDCSASGAPSGSTYDYVWTARGATPNTDKLSSTTIEKPTFDVPEEVDADTDYEYTLTASAENAENGVANVTVRVLNKEPLSLICTPVAPVYEGSADFALDCSASGAPSGSTYDYVWTARGATPNTDKLSSTTVAKPTFDVPEEVASDTAYEYTLTVSAENAENASANVTVRVLNKEPLSLICTPPTPVYEGSADFALDCSASGAPSGSTYDYVWTARGATPNTDKLSSTTVEKPTFYVPEEVAEDETYRYTLTASAENAEDASANVTVRVLNKEPLSLICTPVAPVYEGSADFALDCSASGAPSGSTYDYVWTARGATPNTDKLSSTTVAKPTFDVPEEVASDTAYEYTLTVSAENAENASANVTVRVLNKEPLSLICTPPTPVYEGSADFALDCSASGAPSGSEYDYVWTARGATPNTDKLSSTTVEKPTFYVPEEVAEDETYRYTLTASAENAEDASANVTVRVLNKAPLALICTPVAPVYEGSEDFDLDCVATGAPAGSDYAYVWTGRGTTSNTALLVSGTDGPTPTFDVPEEVAEDETYRYTLTASAENAEDASANVTVRVLNKEPLALICTPPTPVYEGSADFALDCSASGAPSGSTYDYVWTARGATPNTDKLSSTTIAKPTFDVPEEVDRDETYEYTLTVSADHAESATEDVTVTVLNKEALAVVCATPSPVYEGSEDFALDCAATGAPAGSDYTYVWTGRGTTSNTDLLVSGTDGPTPTFDVPEEVDEDKTYEYLLTVSAENATDATAEVTVTVLKLGSIALICASPPLVYEGSEDFALDCSVSGDTGDTDYTYEWRARGATANTDLLIAGTDGPTPTFAVPDALDETTTYEYFLTVSADNAEDGAAEVTVTVLNRGTLDVACTPPPLVYEGSADFALDCTASGAPVGSDYEYVWTGRGSTVNTDLLTSGTDSPTPTFAVPDALDETTTYEYLLTASAENAESGSAAVTVTVLNRGALSVVCVDPPSVYEGSADFDLDCSASGAPVGSDYEYVWAGRGSTVNTDLLTSGTDSPTPTFAVPDALDETTTYEYLLTASAENAESGSAAVTVTVLNRGALSVVCADPPSIYEGSEDFALDCSASGAPAGSEYAYAWTARGSTANTDLLIAGTDGPTPTFAVPEELDATTTYEYLLTASAENAESGSAAVTVTVLNVGALRVVCASPASVYEGSEDFDLDCSASGAPAGSDYAYVWTARGSTANTDILIAGTNGPTPTFSTPDEVEETTTYEYLLTASAENAESGSAEVTVKVLNFGSIALICTSPPLVYEGSEDFELDCSILGDTGDTDYTYEWTARGATANTDELSATDISSPTFYVPDALDATTTYEYLLTARAANVEDATAEVTVTVLNRGTLAVACAPPPLVYEGSEDFALDCTASGAPVGSDYEYVWTARGSTSNTDLLIAGTDGPTPTFYVPDALDETTTYEYLLTASAENAESSSARVTVTVLNHGALRVVCADPPSIYEGSEDFALDCSASGAPAGSEYTYAWTARGSTANTDLLIAGTDSSTPTFAVPDALDRATTYEYLLTVSAENAESGSAEVTVTVLNAGALHVVCASPASVYEGSEDITLDCTASGAPAGSDYAYVWAAQGDTENTLQLSATDISSPTFYVPDAVDVTTDYEYLLTVSVENAEDRAAEVVVTVLNRGALSVVCTDPGSVYEGSEDFTFDCTASGAPAGPEYTYVWTAQGDTQNTLQLSATDIPSPTFYVPDEVDETTTYKYLLTASADNAEDASAEVMVTVLDGAPLAFVDDAIAGRVYIFTVGEIIADILLPEATGGLSPYTYTLAPVLPRGLSLKVDGDTTRTISGTPLEVSPRTEYTWQVTDANAETAQIAFSIEVVPAEEPTSVPVAETSSELPELSSLGVTVSASSLRFGVQSAETQVSLDPMTDQISTHVSGLYHAGRMTLSPGGSEALDENGEMDLSIELASPVVLRREGGIEAASIVLAPQWSLAESCEQLSSQTIGGLYTEVTLSDAACRLLRFGGELDLTGVLSGHYAGSMDIILRSGESEETHTVDVEVTVVPAQRVITIGPGGVRFSTSREIPVGLTEEQNLSIYPDVAFLTEEKPHGVFELSNPSLIPLEISVSARFGYTEATADGHEVVVENASGSHLGDLSQVVDIHPGVLVLMPGEKGLVRYGVKEGAFAAMAERGYAAFFDVVSEPRQYVRTDQMPEEVAGDRTARVTMRVPGVYVPGEGSSQLRAALLSISFVGPMSVTFLLETEDHPFAGEVVAYDGDGRELGRRETLVYTRSRVRIPLDRMPEEGTVFLRFSPRGSGRVPEPASVEWDAPRRDIGAAEDKDRATTTETLARKP